MFLIGVSAEVAAMHEIELEIELIERSGQLAVGFACDYLGRKFAIILTTLLIVVGGVCGFRILSHPRYMLTLSIDPRYSLEWIYN